MLNHVTTHLKLYVDEMMTMLKSECGWERRLFGAEEAFVHVADDKTLMI